MLVRQLVMLELRKINERAKSTNIQLAGCNGIYKLQPLGLIFVHDNSYKCQPRHLVLHDWHSGVWEPAENVELMGPNLMLE